jgi:acetyltransferase-like isoleucine patch superfamily enzyme
LKTLLKRSLQGIFLVLTFPTALLSGFGRIAGVFRFWAHSWALIPGLPGDYARIAYYTLTLEKCSIDSRIEFGSYFAHPQARVARGVYIGSYCVLGRAHIGERCQIASGVQVLSGKRQHPRDAQGRIMGAEHGIFETVPIGADCWIGAGVIVLAEVGPGCTLAAGSVVIYPLPAGSVAAGNPARVVQTTRESLA